MKVLVIGSGATGVSAAYAALYRGWDVTMFDAGLTPFSSGT
jgi:glycine/D-amino acid oxidase-like deaminating enzyme